MPTFRTINIGLASQFDLNQLPEFAPPKGLGHPPLQDDDVVSVYIPAFAGSQFWVCYDVEPMPQLAQGFFYFKLFIEGEHIVSWGTGKSEGFKGKTVFGLWNGMDLEGKRVVEKRGLFFPKDTPAFNIKHQQDGAAFSAIGGRDKKDSANFFEIRVFRSKARRRIPREIEVYKETRHSKLEEKGIELKPSGQCPKGQPKKFYQYALSDPLDKPYATFRFYYKTWEELESYGLAVECEESEDSHDVIEQDNAQLSEAPTAPAQHSGSNENVGRIGGAEQPDSYIDTDWLLKDDDDDPQMKRLSIPPTQKLHPTRSSSFMVSASPSKPYRLSPGALPEKYLEARDTFLRTSPKPIAPMRDLDSPSPGQKRNSGSQIF